MASCRLCKTKIKWIQVPEVSSTGTETLKWRAFDKTKNAAEPYRRHACPKLGPDAAKIETRKPWWVDND